MMGTVNTLSVREITDLKVKELITPACREMSCRETSCRESAHLKVGQSKSLCHHSRLSRISDGPV